MTHETRVNWLKCATVVLLIAFGPLLAFSTFAPFDWVVQNFVALARLDPSQPQIAEPGGRLVTAIAGGIVTGFGVCLWQVVTRVYAKDPIAGRAILLPAILTWYILDSAGSVAAGAWFNGVLNTVFVACFLVPLLWKAPATAPSPNAASRTPNVNAPPFRLSRATSGRRARMAIAARPKTMPLRLQLM